jgi:archaetidylinositol phosphate synthase
MHNEASGKAFLPLNHMLQITPFKLKTPLLTKLKKQVQQMLTSQANAAHKLGLTPNKISLIGFGLSVAAALSYALALNTPWLLLLAVVLLLASGFCDTLDGIVARSFQQATAFGGFLDSMLDRYADAIIFAAIIVAGLSNAAWNSWSPLLGTIWGLAALAGALLTSYARARAEAAGIKMESVGLIERAERMLILAVISILAFFWLPIMGYGIALLAVLSNFTVLQRIWHVYCELKKKQ